MENVVKLGLGTGARTVKENALFDCRYFYLIVFAMYVREIGPQGFPKTFKEWMDEHASLKDMIAEGRGKLEWERKIPDEKLVDLKDLLDCKDFKKNLHRVRVTPSGGT